MSSCGNPAAEGSEALMQGRLKYDKSTNCIRCKTERGNIVIRHAVYCKACFFPLVTTRFRRCMDPHINAAPDAPRRTALKASGNLLVGYSGGLGSAVLLDVLARTYFPPAGAHSGANGAEGKGGKAHPRNKRVWAKAYVCYVEVCAAFPEGQMKDRSTDVRDAVGKSDDFELVLARLDDAFDSQWWTKVRGSSSSQALGIDFTNEDLPLLPEDFPSQSPHEAGNPTTLLRIYLSSLPTPTAVQSAISTLTRLVLTHTARRLQCSHLALGTSLTSLSISLINSIAQGGGFSVPEESFEEWDEGSPATAESTEVHEGPDRGKVNVRIVRPLRDVGMKECAAWAWWMGVPIVGRGKLPGLSVKQTIGGLTKSFIIGLERDYPSTVSTIARTVAKLAPKDEPSGRCALCERPFPSGVLDWKSRISIRSLDGSPRQQTEPTSPPLPLGPQTHTRMLSPHLCYACLTLLTSKSSRSNIPLANSSVRLPMWTIERLLRDREAGEVRKAGIMGKDEMKSVVDEFLLEE
ncbi:hypothetical protein M0805_001624 [Coniferiporia weirii]|nr:hypothetical protein M0805_001624 [Coniferiporia weirii]